MENSSKLFDGIETFIPKLDCDDIPEVRELRDKRNEYNRLASECQSQIDKLIMESHKVPDIIGKFVKIDSDEETVIFGHVASVERLHKAIRISFDVMFTNQIYKGGLYFRFQTDEMCYEEDVVWSKLGDITVISKNDFLNQVNNHVNTYLERTNYDENTNRL